MEKAAIFAGDYMDLRFMRGLKSARIYIDIPIEHSDAFLKAFGAPNGVNPAKVAIALMDVEALKAPKEIGPNMKPDDESGYEPPATQAEAERSDKPRTPFREMKRSAQAAIKLGEPEFQEWVQKNFRGQWIDASTMFDDPEFIADATIKSQIGIQSKRELDTSPAAGRGWDALLASFDYRGRA
jgi:hypothetical protein